MSSRAEEKQRRRTEREEVQAAEAAKAARARNLKIIGAVLGTVVLVAVVAIVLASSGGSSKPKAGDKPEGAADVAAMLDGIPQQGQTLGKASAPLTLVEYGDLKCPVCKEFNDNVFPQLVSKYVRPGKLRIVFRTQHFVGEQLNPGDSLAAAQFAVASGQQDKQFNVTELFYRNQQDESTRYVDENFLRFIGSGVPGLNVDTALAASDSAAVKAVLAADAKAFTDGGFTGTPGFELGPTKGEQKTLDITSVTDAGQFTSAIDAQLK